MTKNEFSKWLSNTIAELHAEEADHPLCEDAADYVREARRIAESLGWPDLIPPCKADAFDVTAARRRLAQALAVVDPPASGPLTVKQVAERLSVSPKTVYDMVEKGRLRCIRIGRAIRIRPSDLNTEVETPHYKHLRI